MDSDDDLVYDKATRMYRPRAEMKVEPVTSQLNERAPLESYLEVSSPLPKELETSQRLLFVLDLNGTVLSRPPFAYAPRYNRLRSEMAYLRPHLTSFLKWGLSKHHIAIWSSAAEKNVVKMMDLILRHMNTEDVGYEEDYQRFIELNTKFERMRKTEKLKFDEESFERIWTRKCLGLSSSEMVQKVETLKDLGVFWASKPAETPTVEDFIERRSEYATCWNESNTIMIDDSINKTKCQPYNTVLVPTFEAHMQPDHDMTAEPEGTSDTAVEERIRDIANNDEALLAVAGIIDEASGHDHVGRWINHTGIDNEWFNDEDNFRQWVEKGRAVLAEFQT